MESKEENKEPRLLKVDLKCQSLPSYVENRNNPWVKWGAINNYPYYLMTLLKRDSFHGSIIKAKSEYVYGKGLTYNKEELSVLEQAQYDQFLSRANDSYDWNELFRRSCEPGEVYNGMAYEVIWKVNQKCDVFALNPGLIRTNKDQTEYYYCEAWTTADGKENSKAKDHKSFRVLQAFDPNNRKGVQILFYKVPFLTVIDNGHLYPEPNYIQVIQDIETNIKITNFHNNNMDNNMFASALLSFFDGKPTRDEAKKIKEQFLKQYQGTDAAGSLLFWFGDKDSQPVDHKSLSQADLDKMFEVVSKRVQQNIFSGHKFDPILGGIMQEGQLGGAKEILEKYDKFVKTYVQYRQEIHLNIIKMFGEINGVDISKLEVKQTSPVREELPINSDTIAILGEEVIKNYLAKKYDIELPEQEVNVADMSGDVVNENITGLSLKNYNKLKSLIKKYNDGKMSRQELEHLVAGFGLGQDYLKKALGEQFSADILKAFEACAIDDTDDEIIDESFIHTKVEALEKHFNAVRKQFDASISDQVLELMKGDPAIATSKMAKILNVDEDTIKTAVESLVTVGLIAGIAKGIWEITKAGLEKPSVNVEYETYTVYAYVTRPDVPSVETTSRPFCKRLLELTRSGKRWTKEALDNITNSTGEDAWTYRGGFYTNPNTQETTPYCRHLWKSISKVRRKK